ncbi:MAG: hypothetical protein PVG07_03060 [Acidobacteriota bacterium]|jgi:hypothetical protein
MNSDPKILLRILFGVILLLVGAVLSLVAADSASPMGTFGQSVGLALLVTGCISVFQESVLVRLKRDEVQEAFNRLFDLLAKPGIRMVARERQGDSRYHKWLLEKDPQTMFFAGHSVLHRVERDFKDLRLLSVEEALRQKVAEGSTVRVLFLDPTWDLIDRIAMGQDQDPKDLRADLATTLGVCRRLWDLLENEELPGTIEIKTCRELQQYAFHYVICSSKRKVEMLAGFYFAGRVGMRSPLFSAEDESIQELFVEHFNTIFEHAKTVLEYSRGSRRDFNFSYYRSCQNDLSDHLGSQRVSELCP